MEFYALDAYWQRYMLCIVIFGRTLSVQSVHLIIFSSYSLAQQLGVLRIFVCIKRVVRQKTSIDRRQLMPTMAVWIHHMAYSQSWLIMNWKGFQLIDMLFWNLLLYKIEQTAPLKSVQLPDWDILGAPDVSP